MSVDRAMWQVRTSVLIRATCTPVWGKSSSESIRIVVVPNVVWARWVS